MKTRIKPSPRSYTPGDFIADLDDAHDLIHEFERLLGDSPSDLDGQMMNIDVCNEELERLSKRVAGASTVKASSVLAQKASKLVVAPAQPTLHGFKAGTGMSKLIAAIQKTNP